MTLINLAPADRDTVDPNDRAREYPVMIEGLHGSGLRVIQYVVFNHTENIGEMAAANLDELVLTYYYRLAAKGALETGSCCADTASEHHMGD